MPARHPHGSRGSAAHEGRQLIDLCVGIVEVGRAVLDYICVSTTERAVIAGSQPHSGGEAESDYAILSNQIIADYVAGWIVREGRTALASSAKRHHRAAADDVVRQRSRCCMAQRRRSGSPVHDAPAALRNTTVPRVQPGRKKPTKHAQRRSVKI